MRRHQWKGGGGMRTSVERSLWLTVPGARAWLALGWLLWLGLALLFAPRVGVMLGPGGAAIGFLAAGWAFARALPSPVECFRRYHLDDDEVTAIGPGAKVRRLAWDRVETVTQRGGVLGLAGDGIRVAVPFRRLAETSLWSAALARVVPELATDVWDRLEDGEEVRLAPVLDPAWTTLTWWAWGPTAVASVAIGGASALGIAAVLASAERVVVFALARARRIRLDRAGIAIRDGPRGRREGGGLQRRPCGELRERQRPGDVRQDGTGAAYDPEDEQHESGETAELSLEKVIDALPLVDPADLRRERFHEPDVAGPEAAAGRIDDLDGADRSLTRPQRRAEDRARLHVRLPVDVRVEPRVVDRAVHERRPVV